MDCAAPPKSYQLEWDSGTAKPRDTTFGLAEENKLHFQYCDGRSTRAGPWRTHLGAKQGEAGMRFDTKPVVSVPWQEVESLCDRHSTEGVKYPC